MVRDKFQQNRGPVKDPAGCLCKITTYITISYHVYNPILSSQQRRDEHLPAAGAAAEALRRAEARCETGQQPGES